MRFVKISTICLAVLFTAQACDFLFGELGGSSGSGPRGIFLSVDSASTWAESNAVLGGEGEFSNASVSQIFLEAGNPGNILVSTANAGVFATDNGGSSWVRILPGVSLTSGFINPQNKQEIFAAGVNGSKQAAIWKSSDRGKLWAEIFTESSGKASVASLVFDPLLPNVFYAALSTGTVIKSNDGGLTWEVLTETKIRPRKLAVARDSARTVYLQGDTGLMRSRDGGKTWESLVVGAGVSKFNNIFVETGNPANVYAATESGLFRSTDSGISWSTVLLPAENAASSVTAAAVNHDNPNQIFAAIRWTVYTSSDRGITWKTISLPTRRVISELAVDLFEPNKIYAGLK